MGGRRFNALSLSIDGAVYQTPASPGKSTLDSFYKQGQVVWPLDEIRSAGAELVRALVEFETCAGQ